MSCLRAIPIIEGMATCSPAPGTSSLHPDHAQYQPAAVDRMTMAHGVEGRVPFLDTAMIDMAMSIPAEVKLRQADDKPIENGSCARRSRICCRTRSSGATRCSSTRQRPCRSYGRRGRRCVTPRQMSGPTMTSKRLVPRRRPTTERVLSQSLDEPARVLPLVAHWNERPAA